MKQLEKLNELDFDFKKRFGQNFIFDTNLLSAIVADAGITSDDFVVEVGTGAGTLTKELAKKAWRVLSYEIDTELSTVLSDLKLEHDNLEIVFGDILKANLNKKIGDKPFKVVANLPYYITTLVIFYFLAMPNLRSLTVMVQREVAERFIAKENTASYGAVTAQLAVYGEPKITRVVSRKLFTPPPNVDSAIVRLDINKKEGVNDYALLQKLIASSFAMRRKTLVNNLMAGFSLSRDSAVKLLANADISETVRGETLGIGDFIRLANLMAN